MNTPYHTKTFKSGNSVAVRLPKGFGIPADAEVVLEKFGDTITLRLARNPEGVRRRMREAWEAMEAIGAPEGGVQARDKAEEKRRMLAMLDRLNALPKPPEIEKREPIEFPDRPEL